MPSFVSSSPVAARRAEFSAALAQLARADLATAAFHAQWLKLLIAAVEALGGRLRRPAENGTLTSVADMDFPPIVDEQSATQYEALVMQTYAGATVRVIPPTADASSDSGINPTGGLLLLAPLVIDGEARGVVELILAAEAGVERQKEAVSAIYEAAMSLAAFERRVRERKLHARQSLVDDVERFVRSIHDRLALHPAAYAIANDGRRLIGCDRLTVLVRRGRRYLAVAISGVEAVETRSESAKLLARAATVVAQTKEPVWLDGQSIDLPPQVRAELEKYVDDAHVRQVAVLPLLPPADEPERRTNHLPVGVLVVEQIDGEILGDAGRERAQLVAEHAAVALTNALRHEAIPLLPLWRAVAAVRQWFAPGTRARAVGAIVAFVAAIAALKFVPANLTLTSKAVLRPAVRQHVFAPLDGTVKRVLVRHGDHVEAGQLLIELRNTDLDVSLADAVGRRAAAEEQLFSIERALHEDGTKLSAEERHRMAGRRGELRQKLTSIDEELKLLRSKRLQLEIVSPIAGEVTTWNVAEALENRPVRQGQVLVDVADIRAAWELELQVSENDIGHLLRAQAEAREPLRVDYRLNAEPDTDRLASVHEIHLAAEFRGEEGNTVLVRADVDPNNLPPLRPGAEAKARVHCGVRSVGYVWFHDAVDFVRTKILFHLY